MVKTIVLKLRDVIAILTENGFVALPQKGTSHIQYRGTIDGQTRVCTVDMSITDWVWKSHTALYYLIKTELRIDAARFFGGHKTIARRAQVPYRRFGDGAGT